MRDFVPRLKAGDHVMVRYGRRSIAVAQVIEGYDSTRNRVLVVKFNEKTRHWTKPTWCYAGEVIRRALVNEIAFASVATDVQAGRP